MVILELNNNNQKQTPLRYCTITSGKTILKVSRTFMLILLAELQSVFMSACTHKCSFSRFLFLYVLTLP